MHPKIPKCTLLATPLDQNNQKLIRSAALSVSYKFNDSKSGITLKTFSGRFCRPLRPIICHIKALMMIQFTVLLENYVLARLFNSLSAK